MKGVYIMEIKNAQITGTKLGREDHGIMTFMIFVRFDVAVTCGIGGYCLDQAVTTYADDKPYHTQRVFRAEGLEAISKVLDTVGVDNWEDLKGKYIRIKDNGWGKSIDEIGNLMEEKWFNMREFFENAQKGVNS
jgi:hypothetical protein